MIQVISQPSCLSALLTPLFFLVLLGLAKRSLWDPLIRALRVPLWLSHLVWISSGCGSAVVQRSSRSLRGFGASLPVAGSHPSLVGYKAIYPLFISNLSCYRCSSISYLSFFFLSFYSCFFLFYFFYFSYFTNISLYFLFIYFNFLLYFFSISIFYIHSFFNIFPSINIFIVRDEM
jgi:hypothetical protein